MRINLRGGGDIASNPERLRCRLLTGRELMADMVARDIDAYQWWHGAGAPDSAPGSTATGQDGSRYGFRGEKPATGQEGALDAKPDRAVMDQVWADSLAECAFRAAWHTWNTAPPVPHPPKDGAHP